MVEDSKVGNGRTRGQKRKAKEAETSHPQSSKVEENRREYDLPFGWKKVAYMDKGRNGEWTITIRAPNGKRLYSSKEIENFVKQYPEIEYDAKLTNTFRPPELRKTMPSMTKVEEKKAEEKDDLPNPGQDPPKKPMEQETIVVFPPQKMEDTSLPYIFNQDDYDFICQFCGKGFFRSLDNLEFKTHICNYCPYCPEIFIEIDDLNDHIKKTHKEEAKAKTADPGGK